MKKKGRTVTTGKIKEEPSSFLIKPKTKKPVTTKKENQAEKSRCVDLITDDGCRLLFVLFFVLCVCVCVLTNLYPPQFSGAAIRNTAGEQTTQELHIQSSLPSHQHPKDETCAETEMWVFLKSRFKCRHPAVCFRTRCVCDTCALTVDGKLEDGRPSLLAKLLSSGSVPELGHSSSSEGEKEFPSPEWDVPLSKNSIRKSSSERNAVSVQCSPIRLVKFWVSPVLYMQKLIVFSRSPSRR